DEEAKAIVVERLRHDFRTECGSAVGPARIAPARHEEGGRLGMMLARPLEELEAVGVTNADVDDERRPIAGRGVTLGDVRFMDDDHRLLRRDASGDRPGHEAFVVDDEECHGVTPRRTDVRYGSRTMIVTRPIEATDA